MTHNAPAWRDEPYRLFFPVGMGLAWAGVLHWLLHAVGLLAEYQSVFHAIAQIQGFMMSFAVGFLFTAVPRRTETPPPAAWQMVLGLTLPVATTVAAWYQNWALSQIFWLTLVGIVVAFVARRFLARGAGRRPPNSFLWVPLSFAMGVVGSILTAAIGVFGEEYYDVHNLGQLLVLQGLFLGLVAGVGGMVLPLITRGEAPPDASREHRDHLSRLGHVSAFVVLCSSFWIENWISLRGGLLLRAAVLATLLLFSARLWKPPTRPGWHRRLVWLSAWMLPTGYLVAAVFPEHAKAGLHVVFIAGFALMAFSVGLHVTLAHGGHRRLLEGKAWQVPAYGALILLAASLRVLVDFDPARFFVWIGASAASFLAATIFWALLVIPRLWRRG